MLLCFINTDAGGYRVPRVNPGVTVTAAASKLFPGPPLLPFPSLAPVGVMVLTVQPFMFFIYDR